MSKRKKKKPEYKETPYQRYLKERIMGERYKGAYLRINHPTPAEREFIRMQVRIQMEGAFNYAIRQCIKQQNKSIKRNI